MNLQELNYIRDFINIRTDYFYESREYPYIGCLYEEMQNFENVIYKIFQYARDYAGYYI